MQVILAQPRGFCAGVIRAIDIVERALEKYGAPVYVRHEIVHNKHVVDSLKAKGARFIDELSEAPAGAVTIFSAHGVARVVEQEAEVRGLKVLNATCPLVTKVHIQGKNYVSAGREVILIGHAGHPEVEGTMGQIDGPVHLVQTEDEAKAIKAELDKGADFAKLAKEKSKDPGASDGGDLGFFTKEQMVPEFSKVAFSLEPGKISDPVKTQFGWHIIKAEEKRNRKPPTFEQVKPQIEQYVTRKAQSEYVAKLRETAQVERMDKPAAPAVPAPATPATPPAKK